MDCLFCKIVAGTIPCRKVYEDADHLGFLDIHPINPGHTLVIPKRHVESLAAADPAMLGPLFAAAQKVGEAAKAATGADAYNIGVNVGATAGQMVMHLHVHVMPRFADDGHQHWQKKPMTDDEMAMVQEKMRIATA
jgi:histidine triad (HIT) family protein